MSTQASRVDELAAIVKPALPNHCCDPSEDLADCPWDAHDAQGVAKAVIEAGWMKVDGPYAEIFDRQRKEIFDLARRLDKASSEIAYYRVLAEGRRDVAEADELRKQVRG